MLDPFTLFSYAPHVDPHPIRAHTLIVALQTFGDAGHLTTLVSNHLVETLPGHRIGSFDADQLTDYRDERGKIHFSGTAFSGYTAPSWDLYHLTDEAGEGFLLLTGPEPALQWERLCAAIMMLIDRHDVGLTVGVHGVAMPVPHTRPIVISRWANDPSLLEDYRTLFPPMSLLASFQSVLTQRLGENGLPMLGLAAHIPHFLAGNDYPEGGIALINGLREWANLQIPTMQLAIAAGVMRAQLAQEVAASEEVQAHVTELENNYDEFQRRREIAAAEESLPDADEIGQAAEEFLRSLDEGEQDPGEDDDRPEGQQEG